MILEDIFGDITFDIFAGENINKISSNVFKKTGEKIKIFQCHSCKLENHSKYNLDTIFNQMSNLEALSIDLNTELPSFSSKNLREIKISANELKIKDGAFQNLNKLKIISFIDMKITIQRNAFNFPNSSVHFRMNFYNCKIIEFENRSFDGIKSVVQFEFYRMNISHLDEGAFKSVLDNKVNSIVFGSGNILAEIDCDDCKNYWLVKEGKEKQVKNAKCKGEKKNLFDDEIKTKLNQKCK